MHLAGAFVQGTIFHKDIIIHSIQCKVCYQENEQMNESLNKLLVRIVGSNVMKPHELKICLVFRSGEVLYQIFITAFPCPPTERLHPTGRHHDLQHRGCHVRNNTYFLNR